MYGFDTCASGDTGIAWGLVQANRPNNYFGSPPHVHTIMQMICIWSDRFSRTATNSQGLRYRYLVLEHELAHVLNLAHPTDDHSALMRDGRAMLELNTFERDAIRNHY